MVGWCITVLQYISLCPFKRRKLAQTTKELQMMRRSVAHPWKHSRQTYPNEWLNLVRNSVLASIAFFVVMCHIFYVSSFRPHSFFMTWLTTKGLSLKNAIEGMHVGTFRQEFWYKQHPLVTEVVSPICEDRGQGPELSLGWPIFTGLSKEDG